MGILDHQRTWRYRVQAPPEQCVQQFARAFRRGGGLVARAHWEVRPLRSGAVAVYQGRKGLAAVASGFSRVQMAEEEGAIGSQVTFEVEAVRDGQTTCAMWLSEMGKRWGFTADARFIRPYMRSVERRLRELDPELQVAKD